MITVFIGEYTGMLLNVEPICGAKTSRDSNGTLNIDVLKYLVKLYDSSGHVVEVEAKPNEIKFEYKN